MSSPSFPQLSAVELRKLRQLLTKSGYATALEHAPSSKPTQSQDLHPNLEILRRLFAQGDNISNEEAERSLDPLDTGSLLASGLIQRINNQIRAVFQIQIYCGLFFFADLMPLEHLADLVLPIGPSGKYLASVTIRRPVKTALDMGCGCGIQSLLLARHVSKVTSTDINPRALELTRLNAAFNLISNIEILDGSYFEPVRGRTFDLIVANLPYVITPEKKFIYRDISQGGDNSIRQTVEQVSSYLTEGGIAHIMLNWIHKKDQAWWEPVEEWLAHRNSDAWLLYTSSMSPEEYTKQWILINEKDKPEEYAKVRDTWLKWYQSMHIERIAFGTVSIRRRSNKANWRCSVFVRKTVSEPLGDHILHLFESQDHLSNFKSQSDILKIKLRPWNLKLEPLPSGNYQAQSTTGYLLQIPIHYESAQILLLLNGKRSLEKAIQISAKNQKIAPETIELQVIKDIYQLMNVGIVEPVH